MKVLQHFKVGKYASLRHQKAPSLLGVLSTAESS